mgnify:CR=1 FL=1
MVGCWVTLLGGAEQLTAKHLIQMLRLTSLDRTQNDLFYGIDEYVLY